MCSSIKKLKNYIVKTPKVVKDENEKYLLLTQYHENLIFGDHPGRKRMNENIRLNYYWENMNKHIVKFINNCDKCNKNKINKHTKTKMIITDRPERSFDTVVVDTIGPPPKTEIDCQYAVTMICNLSKYLIIVPVKNKSAKTIT